MRGHTDLLRRLQHEPTKEFSTSDLVEALYPTEWRRIRHAQKFGSRDQQRLAQREKSSLHRKALYHIGQLVRQGLLAIARLDAHGEKVYTMALHHATVQSAAGPIQLERHELQLPMLAEDLESHRAFLFDATSVLNRYESVYLSAAGLEGLGQLLQYTENALRITGDTLAIGELTGMLSRYRREDLVEFVQTLMLQTLDEGRSICLLLDATATSDRLLADTVAQLEPNRIMIILVAEPATLRTAAVIETVAVLQNRLEKLSMHVREAGMPPAYWGRAGPYTLTVEAWKLIRERSTPVVVVSRGSVALDLERCHSMSAGDLVAYSHRVAAALFSMAAQQRLAATGAASLALMTSSPSRAVQHAAVTLRLWNYNWENPHPGLDALPQIVADDLLRHASVYRACGLPLDPELLGSSAFSKYHPGLSTRSYRKWTITDEHDLHATAFREYCAKRRRVSASLGGVDRLRINRTGKPAPEQVAAELATLASTGFPLITFEFRALQGVRKLTEFLP